MISVPGSEQKAPSPQHAHPWVQHSVPEAQTAQKHHRSLYHTHLHRRDKEEKTEKSVPGSLQPSTIVEGTKSEGVTPNGSHSGSRTASVATEDIMAGRQQERRVVKEGELKAEKERSDLHAAQLQKSLAELNTLSHTTSSRLDNTYYSVLEKLSALNDTIASLKELAVLTRQLNDDFIKESTETVKEIDAQLDEFQDFQGQERKIGDIEHRIETGKARAQMLGDRVKLVRQKIERWERVEDEWRDRTRKRLKILWTGTVVTVLILLGLVAFQYTIARAQGLGLQRGFNVSSIEVNILEAERIPRDSNETRSPKKPMADTLEERLGACEEELEDDPWLRAFDEL